MAVFKCKMCGGMLDVTEGATTCECEFCGTKQTVPTTKDEVITNLYNRANNLRLKCEFDKAEQIYEKIVEQNDSEAEAHWGIVLCKYGIEYVEDPKTFTRVPTCHRTLFDSVIKDVDYNAAIDYADISQQSLYESEARNIDKIQKSILAIVKEEKPYDVFICYKEADETGKRTVDSVIANDIYHQLTQEGLKVFYAAITLEDKLGQDYEPYIFAALNSSKVMLAVGTKPEYFTAVWVKNEWSRFMNLMKTDSTKLLIPCYRDMDAYDLPEEFSHLQAQDMSKIGFINDVVRGVNKVLGSSNESTTQSDTNNNNAQGGTVDSYLKRVFMFLEDGEWDSANEYCEKVLDIDPENAVAYLGKSMAALNVKTRNGLADVEEPFDNDNNFLKAIKFGDDSLKTELEGYIHTINNRIENHQKDIDVKVEAIARAAEAKINGGQSLSLDEKIEKLQKEKTSLETKKEEYPSVQKEYEELTEKKKNAELKITELAEKKKMLGAFKGKEKKAIDTETEKLQSEIRNFDNNISSLKEKLNDSPESIEGKISAIMTNIATLEEDKKKSTSVSQKLLSYDEANALLDDSDVENAFMLKYRELRKAFPKLAFFGCLTGDIVEFGRYNIGDGINPLKWKVLAKEGNKALLITEYGIDGKKYNEKRKKITWETCSLRKWLNNDFYNTAFSEEENRMISITNVTADANPDYDTNQGNNTKDKVFLLSINEAKKYFASDGARQCAPTDFAVTNRAFKDKDNGNCWWWLRSSGIGPLNAAVVVDAGGVRTVGINVDLGYSAVRPALWINL